MARNRSYRNEGMTFMAVGVVLGCALFVVGADGLSAVLGYACAIVVFVFGALMIRRSGGGGG